MSSTDDIADAINLRSKFRRRLYETSSPAQRLARFYRLQHESFRVLRMSPAGYQHFLRRNMHSRRVEEINGKWRPVSADRRAQQP